MEQADAYQFADLRGRAEEALRQRNRDLEGLNRVDRAIHSTHDLDRTFDQLLGEVHGPLGVVGRMPGVGCGC